MPLPEGDSPDEVFDPTAMVEEASEQESPSTEPASVTEDEPEQERHAAAQPKQFDPAFRTPFDGLLHIGKLTKDFTWAGHDFSIHTLTVGDLLVVSDLHARYRNTMGDVKAYQAAIVAACCSRVDGQPISLPLGGEVSRDNLIRDRYRYITENWFGPVLDVIYEEYTILNALVREVMETLGNPSG